MNSLILISPSLVRGFQPIISGNSAWVLRLVVSSYGVTALRHALLLLRYWQQKSRLAGVGKPQTERSGDRPTHDCQALTASA